jgi:hypothetical protein
VLNSQELPLNGHETSFAHQSPIASVDSPNLSLFINALWISVRSASQTMSASTFAVPQSNKPMIVQSKAPQSRSTETRDPVPLVGRLNAMVVKTAKALLESFRLFEYVSNSGKRRMTAVTGNFLHPTNRQNCKLV